MRTVACSIRRLVGRPLFVGRCVGAAAVVDGNECCGRCATVVAPAGSVGFAGCVAHCAAGCVGNCVSGAYVRAGGVSSPDALVLGSAVVFRSTVVLVLGSAVVFGSTVVLVLGAWPAVCGQRSLSFAVVAMFAVTPALVVVVPAFVAPVFVEAVSFLLMVFCVLRVSAGCALRRVRCVVYVALCTLRTNYIL